MQLLRRALILLLMLCLPLQAVAGMLLPCQHLAQDPEHALMDMHCHQPSGQLDDQASVNDGCVVLGLIALTQVPVCDMLMVAGGVEVAPVSSQPHVLPERLLRPPRIS